MSTMFHLPSSAIEAARQPTSPTLTNVDMILPSSSPIPSDTQRSPPTPQRGFSAFGAGGRRRTSTQQPGLGPRLPVQVSRPSMPGSWQTEEDVHDGMRAYGAGRSASISSVGGRLARTGSNRSSPTHRILQQAYERPDSRISGLGISNGYETGQGSGYHEGIGSGQEETEDSRKSSFDSIAESPGSERPTAESEEADDDITREAEKILANAKKRLTAMEGNLSRARSISLSRSPSDSGSSPRLSRRLSKSNNLGNSWAVSSAKLKQVNSFSSGQEAKHSRIHSEATASTRPGSTLSPRRSLSALGNSTLAGSRLDWTESLESLDRGMPHHLEPLQEDLTASEADLPEIPSFTAFRASPSFYSTTSGSHSLNKVRSNIQLRDLNEQVAELKGKVNNLKERTAQDSLHRASLQRLKTSSPFTDAESWDTLSPKSAPIANAPAEQESKRPTTPQTKSLSVAFRTLPAHDTHGDSPLLPKMMHPRIRHIPPTPTTPAQRHTPNTSISSAATTESSDSIATTANSFPRPPSTSPTPPRSRSGSIASTTANSTPQIPTSSQIQGSPGQSAGPSHEDNPDAFDYSRFLLDSAMTTQLRNSETEARSRSPSGSSTGSQSTTRPRAASASTARFSKASNAPVDSQNALIPTNRTSRASNGSGSAGSSGSSQSISQRRASRGGRGSSASLTSIAVSPGKLSPRRPSEASLATLSPASNTSSPNPAASTISSVGSTHGSSLPFRPAVSHTRQLSTDSTYSSASVASFATALERASSQLALRSLSRSTLRMTSAPPTNGTGDKAAATTYRAQLEAYSTNAAKPAHASSAPDTNASSGRRSRLSQLINNGTYLNSTPTDDATSTTAASSGPSGPAASVTSGMSAGTATSDLQTPTSATFAPLASTLALASSALLSAVLAISHAAVREEDERSGVAPGVSAARIMAPADEEMLGRVLEGVLGAAVGLIGRARAGGAEGVTGAMAGIGVNGAGGMAGMNGVLAGTGAFDGGGEEADSLEMAAWRMRCEVARRALSEEKPGEGF